jgi:hypothetical protein
LIVCSSAFAAMVGSRHQAEAMTDLGDPARAITQKDDGTADDGTHIRFNGIADSADKVRLSVSPTQQVNEIRIRTRLSGQSVGDDRLAVWVDGTAAANKVGTVLPDAGATWGTKTLNLATPISSGSHTIYFGPNQANDAFIAVDWAAFHNTSGGTTDVTPARHHDNL